MDGDEYQLRISTAERERAIAALGQQFSEGRLNPDEFSNRCAAIEAAVNRSDLQPVFADLPVNPASFMWPDVDKAADPQRSRVVARDRNLYLATLFSRLRVLTGIAAGASIVWGLYRLKYDLPGVGGWITAALVFACGTWIFHVFATRLR